MVKILDGMKGKSTSDYTLMETVIAVGTFGAAILAGIAAILFLFAAAANKSGLQFIASGVFAVLCVFCIAVVAYVDPDW